MMLNRKKRTCGTLKREGAESTGGEGVRALSVAAARKQRVAAAKTGGVQGSTGST